MKITISDTVKYIGVDDKDIDLFESQYEVPNGIAYNSYLIMDEKIAIMDTVDARGQKEWEQNLMNELGGKTPDYLVISHLEPDHAGSIARTIELFPDIKLVGNAKTFSMFPQFFAENIENKTVVVKEGETLSLGGHSLKFFMAPMVHWPEVMVTYEESEKILFSADGFGKFGALDTEEDWACEARRYYFNICGKYGAPVQALLKKAAALDIQIVCPLHGPILSENLSYYIDLYDKWSSYTPENKGVLIAYASIHGNTAKAAEKLAELIRAKGEEKVVVSDLAREDMAEVIEDAFRYDRMILAAASYDGSVFPCMQTFLSKLQVKAYQKRTVGILENGSWAPTAARTMKTMLEPMKDVTVLEPVVTIKSTMKQENMADMEALATAVYEAGK
ncbi:MAG: MBL fold metallo-hydrolase [Muribaculaceae bacterium]|nr:MBL fold metallo-hydrolase [Muribaculaceae bacterium]MCM1398971.1 MBL fold metallo-hydrolase [Clostridium sp.]MCM1458829.1 MBL fold metallo-hydrolase [Bacteroides sp.]